MHHFLSVVFFSLLFSLGLNAQNVVITGTITDEETGEPIPFAAVATRYNQGGFANESGQYRIEFTPSESVDSIYSSHVSYQQRGYSVRGLGPEREHEINIQLRSSIIALDLVEVTTRMDPVFLIKKALKNIPKVYGYPEFVMKAYYREYSIEENEYSEFAEALITINDSHYNSPKARSKIYLDDLKTSGYKGEIRETMRHGDENPIFTLYEGYSNGARLHTLHWMTSGKVDFFKDFEFNRLGVYMNRRDTIVRIGYEMVPERTGLSARTLQLFSGWTKGEILINITDMAFIEITRGNEKGSSFSQSSYHKIRGKYYPRIIQKTTGFTYGRDKYYLNNQTLVFTDLINRPSAIRQELTGVKIMPKKQLSEVRIRNKNNKDFDRGLVFLPLSKALEVEKAKRLLQESLGRVKH